VKETPEGTIPLVEKVMLVSAFNLGMGLVFLSIFTRQILHAILGSMVLVYPFVFVAMLIERYGLIEFLPTAAVPMLHRPFFELLCSGIEVTVRATSDVVRLLTLACVQLEPEQKEQLLRAMNPSFRSLVFQRPLISWMPWPLRRIVFGRKDPSHPVSKVESPLKVREVRPRANSMLELARGMDVVVAADAGGADIPHVLAQKMIGDTMGAARLAVRTAHTGVCGVVTDPKTQGAAAGAAAGALVAGTGGALMGSISGGIAGAAFGVPLAPLTLGLSIPVSVVTGGGVGLFAGMYLGSTGGLVGGGALGYKHAQTRGSKKID